MAPSRLHSYSGTLKKVARANARNAQMKIIRKSRFKASLVGDPLQPGPDISRAIDMVRGKSSK